MAYTAAQAPAFLDTDGVRKFTEEELRKIAQATAAMDQTTDAMSTGIANNTTAINTLTALVNKINSNQHARVCRITTDQTIVASATPEKVQFNSVTFDPSNIWDAANFRFKPTVAGVYRVNWCTDLNFAAGGVSLNFMYKNGARVAYGLFIGGGNSPPNIGGGTDLVKLNGTSDYVETWVQINSATTRTVVAASELSYMSIELVRPD